MNRKQSFERIPLCNTRRRSGDEGKKLRFTRDSECGTQRRDVAYLYPYKLG